MAQADVLEYIRRTPHNSNVNVVKGMLGSSESSSLPDVTMADNGDVLVVVDGEWAKAEPGYKCTETETVFFNDSITTVNQGGMNMGMFTPSQPISGDTLTVTMNGTEYELPKEVLGGQVYYGEASGDAFVFTNYPCAVIPQGDFDLFVTENAGTYTVEMSGFAESITTTECFRKAIKNSVETLEHILDGEANGSLRSNTSTPEGNGYALGSGAMALGSDTQASGNNSHAEGNETTASNNASHAEGLLTTASGAVAHAEGSDTTASGEAAHAEGQGTEASDIASHAEGTETTASGEAAHAEGLLTTASGKATHAEGSSTTASGDYSHAQNENTIARGKSQTAIGKFNVAQGNAATANATDYAFIIGNGANGSARSNALAIKWDGTFVFANGTEITPAQFAQILALLS